MRVLAISAQVAGLATAVLGLFTVAERDKVAAEGVLILAGGHGRRGGGGGNDGVAVVVVASVVVVVASIVVVASVVVVVATVVVASVVVVVVAIVVVAIVVVASVVVVVVVIAIIVVAEVVIAWLALVSDHLPYESPLVEEADVVVVGVAGRDAVEGAEAIAGIEVDDLGVLGAGVVPLPRVTANG